MTLAFFGALLALGVGVGGIAGLFGVGGGFVLVPILVALGWGPAQAMGTSLAVVTAMGFGGALAQARRGGPQALHGAIGLGLPAALAAPAGAMLAGFFPAAVLHGAFAVLAASAAVLTLLPPAGSTGTSPGSVDASPGGAGRLPAEGAEGNAELRPVHPGRAGVLGLGVGLLSGLLGVGGGVLMVPGQTRWLGRPHREAVATSLAAMSLAGLSGSLTHLALGHVDLRVAAALALGGMAGLAIGRRGLARLPSRVSRAAFAALALGVALDAARRALMP